MGYRLLQDKKSLSTLARPIAKLFQNAFDFRFVLIGALLPDLIDKPLGHLFFRELIGNGRIYGHTLLFFLLIFIPGLWLYRKKGKTWLITLALADLGHLFLDEIWNAPITLFWPLMGLQFPKFDVGLFELVSNILAGLLKHPRVLFVEVVGFLICLAFFLDILRRRKIRLFIRKGAIN